MPTPQPRRSCNSNGASKRGQRSTPANSSWTVPSWPGGFLSNGPRPAISLKGFAKLGEITVARATRSSVIKPLVRFRKRHLMRRDSLENIRAWAPDSVRVGKRLEQPTAQRIQNAPLVCCGKSLCVRVCPSVAIAVNGTGMYENSPHLTREHPEGKK